MILKGRASVAEMLKPRPATDAAGFLDRALDLRLDEEFCPIMELAAPSASALNAALSAAGINLPIGHRLLHEDGHFMRLWPARIWCIGADALDIGLSRINVGHGNTVLRLRGPNALYFLADYASADLRAAPIRSASMVRCRLGAYNTTLWWTNTRDLYVVVDRSLAQSLVDHLRALALRRDPHLFIE
jgi:hypothetical protein